MSILYIVEPQCYIHKEGDRIVIRKGESTITSIPTFKIQQIIIANNATLTVPLIKTLLENDIDTVFMSLSGKYYGRLQGPQGKNAELRKKLYLCHNDENFKLDFAKSIIKGKISNQRTLLIRIQKNNSNLNFSKEIKKLSELENKVINSNTIDEIRGYEGLASSIYFPNWGKGLKTKDFTFKTRKRRPPTDPVNALLSLGYTFLLHAVARAVDIVGLDPYLGFLHTIEYGRPSLVIDLMEEWRPVIVDSLVLSVLNLGVIKNEDFVEYELEEDEIDPNSIVRHGIRLTNAGWRKFIAQYERKLNDEVISHIDNLKRTYRDTILVQVRHFANYIKGEVQQYKPFLIK